MATRLIIISGFLGAGKTTFINRYLPNLKGKTVVVENEFGDVSLDGSLLEYDVPMKEIYSGCICCSLKGELRSGIIKLIEEHNPDYVLIEPSGVGKLSEVMKACYDIEEINEDVKLDKRITLVEAPAFLEYLEDFGSFYTDQIYWASHIFLTMTDALKEDEIKHIIKLIREENLESYIFTEDFRDLEGEVLLEFLETQREESKDIKSYRSENAIFTSIRFDSLNIDSVELLKKNVKKIIEENKRLTNNLGHVLRIKGVVHINEEAYFLSATRKKMDISKLTDIKNYQNIPDSLIVIGCDLSKDKLFRALTFNGLKFKNR